MTRDVSGSVRGIRDDKQEVKGTAAAVWRLVGGRADPRSNVGTRSSREETGSHHFGLAAPFASALMRPVGSGMSQPDVWLRYGTPPRWRRAGGNTLGNFRAFGLEKKKRGKKRKEEETLTQVLEKATHPLNKHLALNTKRLAFPRAELNICQC